jgi:hypothetical protein
VKDTGFESVFDFREGQQVLFLPTASKPALGPT